MWTSENVAVFIVFIFIVFLLLFRLVVC